MADRWVIVAEGEAIFVIGPKPNQTYRSSEAARKDADQIEDEYDQVHVLPIVGVLDS